MPQTNGWDDDDDDDWGSTPVNVNTNLVPDFSHVPKDREPIDEWDYADKRPSTGTSLTNNSSDWTKRKLSDDSPHSGDDRYKIRKGFDDHTQHQTDQFDWGDDNKGNDLYDRSFKQLNVSERNSRDDRFGNRSDEHRERRQFSGSGNKRTIKIPKTNVGKVIGRGGSTIKELSSKSGARISVNKDNERNTFYDTEVDIFGTDEQCDCAEDLINNIIGRSGQSRSDQSHSTQSYSSQSYSSQSRSYGERNSDYSNEFKSSSRDNDNKLKTKCEADDDFVDWGAAIAESEAATRKKWESLPPIQKSFYYEDPQVSSMTPDEVKTFRKESNNIMVSHFNEEDRRPIPNPITEFCHPFAHYPEVLKEIEKQGFERPSPIQSQSWPILMLGFDLIGIAQTGTGKTLAYLLPAMIHIENQPTPRDRRPGPTALIMAPTRELAQQIEKEAAKYSYRGIKTICIYGGGDRNTQISKVGKGVEIVIATPGRLNDLCMNKHINLSSVSYLVLDEADRMLDMGFEPQIKKIMLDIRPERHTVMMSATWPEGVRRLANNYMKNPIQVYVGSLDLAAVHSVTQKIIMTDYEQKRSIMYEFINNMKPHEKVIIFVDKKILVDDLASDCALSGIVCQSMHGDRDQHDREQALEDMKTGHAKILIATDVAARGLDIEDITHIFNFDFPRNVEEYVHRVGRTGRAGRTGESITLVTREDWKHAKELINILIEANQEVPADLISMAERYGAWKEKHDAEMAACGGRRGGRGGRERGDRGGFRAW